MNIDQDVKIYIALKEVDLRLGIDGYALLVRDRLHLDPFSEAIFLFTNKRHNRLKILYWDYNGFWLFYKRLEEGCFKWPKRSDETLLIAKEELSRLLKGLPVCEEGFKEVKRRFL